MTDREDGLRSVWLVRHAESRGNTGHETDIDPPLSAHGRRQAGQLARNLGHLTFGRVYVSPLKRARETMELSGLCMENVIFDSRIVEWRPEGLYDSVLPYQTLPEYGEADAHDAWRMPFEERIQSFADEVRQQSFDNVLVITHGGVSIGLVAAFLGKADPSSHSPVTLHHMHNTGIARLRLSADGRECRLAIWNHTGHLGPLGEVGQSPP